MAFINDKGYYSLRVIKRMSPPRLHQRLWCTIQQGVIAEVVLSLNKVLVIATTESYCSALHTAACQVFDLVHHECHQTAYNQTCSGLHGVNKALPKIHKEPPSLAVKNLP